MCKLLNYPVDALSSIPWKCEVNQQSVGHGEISAVSEKGKAARTEEASRGCERKRKIKRREASRFASRKIFFGANA